MLPGPPKVIATATPTIEPIPTRVPSEIVNASNGLMCSLLYLALSSFSVKTKIASLIKEICGNFRITVKYTATKSNTQISQ